MITILILHKSAPACADVVHSLPMQTKRGAGGRRRNKDAILFTYGQACTAEREKTRSIRALYGLIMTAERAVRRQWVSASSST